MEKLLNVAARIAAEGCIRRLGILGMETEEMGTLEKEITAAVRLAVEEEAEAALKDAEEAIACHMEKAAEATFGLSMIHAGVKAAERVWAGRKPSENL